MDKFEKMIKGIQEDLEMPEEIWDACLDNIEQLPPRNSRKKNKKVLKYFVISTAAALAMGTACYAMVKSGFLERLQKESGISEENAEKYAQPEIDVKIEEAAGQEKTFENLWKVSEAWCDGSMIYFEAEIPQEILENDRLEIWNRDHVMVNGNACLLNVWGKCDEVTGKMTTKWMCSIDVNGIDDREKMDVEILVRLMKDENEVPAWDGRGGMTGVMEEGEDMASYINRVMENIKEVQTQTLKFSVIGGEYVRREAEPQVIKLTEGEVEVESGVIVPSGIKLAFTYHAEEDAQLPGNIPVCWYIEDEAGNREERMQMQSHSDVFGDDQGRNSMRVELETWMENLQIETNTITVIPCGFDTDEDGKRIPGTQYELENGRFTVEF